MRAEADDDDIEPGAQGAPQKRRRPKRKRAIVTNAYDLSARPFQALREDEVA
jgi:hypothetical protein